MFDLNTRFHNSLRNSIRDNYIAALRDNLYYGLAAIEDPYSRRFNRLVAGISDNLNRQLANNFGGNLFDGLDSALQAGVNHV